jgi:hypothetical protein
VRKAIVKKVRSEEEGESDQGEDESLFLSDDKFYFRMPDEALDITFAELFTGKADEIIKPAPLLPWLRHLH